MVVVRRVIMRVVGRSMFGDAQFKRWYENAKRGSWINADNLARRVGLVCEWLKVSPQQLLKLDESSRNNLVLDLVTRRQALDSALPLPHQEGLHRLFLFKEMSKKSENTNRYVMIDAGRDKGVNI
jgi:hypothetical protein